MAVLRERPYVQFNFLVDLGTGATEGPDAGFQECSEIGMRSTSPSTATATTRRTASARSPGSKSPDVTLKRGIIGSLDLYQWLNDIRNGDQNAFGR